MKTSYFVLAASILTLSGAIAEISAEATDSLKAMSDKLSGAQQLTVEASRTVAPELLKIEPDLESTKVKAIVQRPDKMVCSVNGEGRQIEFYIGKDGSTIFSKNAGFYARFPGKPSISESFDAAEKERGISIPVQDLLCQDPYNDMTAKAKSGKLVGEESVDGESCDHLAFSQEDLDWEIWIAKSDKLPRKFVITLKGVEGKDHVVVDKMNWNLDPKLSADAFVFTAPKGATEIEFVPDEAPEEPIEDEKATDK